MQPVSELNRASLSRVLSDLGDTLLELIGGRVSAANDLSATVIYDHADEFPSPGKAVVLGVGVHEPTAIVDLLYRLGREGAAALVVRSPVEPTPELQRAIGHSGVVLLGLVRGASWAQIAAMLRSLMGEADIRDATLETIGGLPSGDLFALANAIAALIDAPITIEDPAFNVLAFSGRQEESDPSRIEAVLGRKVPRRYIDLYEREGVLSELYRSAGPIYIDPDAIGDDPGTMPRVALAVRAGEDLLGSIWASVPERMDAERNRSLVESAHLVALHLLRARAGVDVERRLRADLMSSALEGGAGATDAVSRLGLLGEPLVVAALRLLDQECEEPMLPADRVAAGERVGEAFAVHLNAVLTRSVVVTIGDTTYGLIPSSRGSDEWIGSLLADFLNRVAYRHPAVIGVGPRVCDSAEVVRSRAGAERALRVLVGRGKPSEVATCDQVLVDSLVLDLSDLMSARGDQQDGYIAQLASYDAEHGTQMAETLTHWLEAFGDIPKAAKAAYTPTNTFRYRLRRVSEICGIDLEDADDQFAAMLELRLRRARDGS